MCAGAAAARAANKNARRQYQFTIEQRKRKHLQKRARYQTAVVQHKQQLAQINAGLARAYSRGQTKLNRLKDKAWRENQTAMIQSMRKSQYGSLLAGGRTGRSIKRVGVMEAAALGRFYAQRASALTDAREDYKLGAKGAKRKARIAGSQSWANVAFAPIADVAPPVLQGQSVGAAQFGDFMGLVGFGSAAKSISDRKLKENIIKIGKSIAGLNIYKFNYIGNAQKYTGVMADEVLDIKPEAVEIMPNGFLGVNYSLIDVEFRMA